MVERIEDLEYDLKILKRLAPVAAVNYIRKAIGYDEYLKDYAEYRRMKPEELFDLLLTDYQDFELLRRTKGRREVTEADEKAVKELCQPYLDWRKEALK